MTISDLGSLGEFISSIAVVLSLIYVAFQLRQNTKEIRAASQESNAHKFVDLNLATASNPDMRQAMMLLQSGKTFEEIEPEQAAIVHLVFNSVYNLTYEYYSRYKKGLADDEHWNSLNHMLTKQMIPAPLFRSWFIGSIGADNLGGSEFAKYVSDEISRFESSNNLGDA